MKPLTQRLISGPCLAAAAVAAAMAAPSITVAALLCAIAVVAIMEFYRLLDALSIPSFRIMGGASCLLLIAGTWFSYVLETPGLAATHELILLYAVLIAVLTRQFPQKHNEQPFATMACTLFGIMYVPFLLNYFTKLLFAWDTPTPLMTLGSTGRRLVFYLMAVVKVTDIGAFAVGVRFGRHKLIPRISPNKTWEGFLGGVLAGLLVSLAAYGLTGGRFGVLTMTLYDAFILGVLLPVMGTVGDLAESMLKRAAGRKDAGRLVPGMGGALDILDSLLFAAPALYIYANILLAPP